MPYDHPSNISARFYVIQVETRQAFFVLVAVVRGGLATDIGHMVTDRKDERLLPRFTARQYTAIHKKGSPYISRQCSFHLLSVHGFKTSVLLTSMWHSQMLPGVDRAIPTLRRNKKSRLYGWEIDIDHLL
jgi:hypothetical protein